MQKIHFSAEKLQNGNVSAVQAVDAFRWKCLAINEKLNCVTDFVREAPDMAKNLDVQFANKAKPPLFGVPFSVKENFHVKFKFSLKLHQIHFFNRWLAMMSH